jgi:hypothetical protein
MIDHFFRAAAAVMLAMGIVVSARRLDGVVRPAGMAVGASAAAQPRPGWICWDVTRRPSARSRHSTRCEAAEGWHIEDWPGVGCVAVPEAAQSWPAHSAGRQCSPICPEDCGVDCGANSFCSFRAISDRGRAYNEAPAGKGQTPMPSTSVIVGQLHSLPATGSALQITHQRRA